MKKTVSVLLMCLACFLCMFTYTSSQELAAKNVIRLHIIANSDSKEDQNVKLLVRNRLLREFSDYTKSHTLAEAENYIRQNLCVAQKIANDVLKENGFDYTATACYGEYDFPARKYGDLLLPAGRYNGLQIRLGNTSGKNWWCVMYPPLCFNEMNTSTTQAETETIKIQFKFKFLELLNSK